MMKSRRRHAPLESPQTYAANLSPVVLENGANGADFNSANTHQTELQDVGVRVMRLEVVLALVLQPPLAHNKNRELYETTELTGQPSHSTKKNRKKKVG